VPLGQKCSVDMNLLLKRPNVSRVIWGQSQSL